MDHLRLTVIPVPPDSGSGFAVEIYVNDIEMTSVGAGLGMDPYDLLVPGKRLEGGEQPTQVPVARCACGVYGCGSTDVVITRTGSEVRWDWVYEAPSSRSCTFERSAYDAEVARAEADTSWETPERSAGRGVWNALRDVRLRGGLALSWMGNDWRDPDVFTVCLSYENTHQVFVDFLWVNSSPAALAAEVVETLTSADLSSWRASWHSIVRGRGAPRIAAPTWTLRVF